MPNPLVRHKPTPNSFTLVELLIVIAILATLTAAVATVLSPATLLAQARDAQRVSDLDSLNTALKLAEYDNVSMGSSSVVYLSLPDTSATCGSYTLPGLPTGWSYHCATSANLSKTDGTGWVPVNFSALSETRFSSLPTDPSQNGTSSLYYSYAAGNRWEVSTMFESAKYSSLSQNDGGYDPATYESGGNSTLAPFMHGLVGYWKIDEGSGVSVTDYSGLGETGTATSGPTWVTTNCHTGSSCLSFSSSTGTYVVSTDKYNFTGKYFKTNTMWIRPDWDYGALDGGWSGQFIVVPSGLQSYSSDNTVSCLSTSAPTVGAWSFVARVFDGINGTVNIYLNGSLVKSCTFAPPKTLIEYYGTHAIGGSDATNSGRKYAGMISNYRTYTYPLTSAQIQAIYNSGL